MQNAETVEALQEANRRLASLAQELTQANFQMEQQAQELAERRRLVEALLEAVPAGILYVDREMVLREANKAYEGIARRVNPDLPPGPITGQPLRDLFPGTGDYAEVYLRQAVATGQQYQTIAQPFHLPDGERQFWDVVRAPVFGEEGAIIGALSLVFDATQRVQLEERIRARTEELEAANLELAAFNAAVSHDLRNPINAIMGYSKIILRERDKLLPHSQDGLERIHRASKRMTELIEDLLRLSSSSDREIFLEPIDVSAMAEGIVEGLRQADPEREVEVQIERGLSLVGDQGLWQIVLTNLLSNAWKYSGKAQAARVEVGRLQRDDQEVLFVRDNGVGFDMAQANRLFQPFSRLTSSKEFKGTGIGLVTVKRIIDRHGGRIWAESSLGEGATFLIALPPARAST